MKKLLLLPILTALFLLMPAQEAQAQTEIQIGPRIGIDVGDIEELFIGAEARVKSESIPVLIAPAFDYYFASSGVEDVSVTVFAIDINALYEFGVDNQAFTPYAGGGIGIIRQSVDFDGPDFGFGSFGGSTTDFGLNLVGGARFMLDSSIEPFAQAKINVGGDFTLFNIMGGVLFNI